MSENQISKYEPKRRRGAQPGNTNAMKHGFYSRQYKKIDLVDSDEIKGLVDEITMLRVYIRHVLGLALDAHNLQEALECLRTLSIACSSLTRLVRTQNLIFGATDEISQALSEALADVTEELNLQI